MDDHPTAAAFRAAAERVEQSGDMMSVMDMLADDIVWHQPGANQFSLALGGVVCPDCGRPTHPLAADIIAPGGGLGVGFLGPWLALVTTVALQSAALLGLYAFGGWNWVLWGVFLRTTIGLHAESALTLSAYSYLLRNLSVDPRADEIWWLPAANDTRQHVNACSGGISRSRRRSSTSARRSQT